MPKYWEINVLYSASDRETLVLPEEVGQPEVERLMQLIMARQLSPDELRKCIWMRGGGRSERLDIQRNGTDLTGGLDMPAVYAHLVYPPERIQ